MYDCKKDQITLLFEVFDRRYRASGNIEGSAGVLRGFLELVHLSIAGVLGIQIKTAKSVKGDGGRDFQIAHWREELLHYCEAVSPRLKESLKGEIRQEYYYVLQQSYGFSNGVLHSTGADVDEGQLNNAQIQAMRYVSIYFRQCERIGIDLVGNVVRRSKYERSMYVAQSLFDALERAVGLGELQWEGDILHAVRPIAQRCQIELGSLLLVGEPRDQGRRLITASLTPLIVWGDACPVFQLAKALAARTNLSEWFKTYNDEAAKQPRRHSLPTLRLAINPPSELTPIQGQRLRPLAELLQCGDWEIRGAFDYWDELGVRKQIGCDIAASASSERELASALYDCVTRALRELPLLSGRARRPSELVLWLSVPIEFVFYDWEGLNLKLRAFPLKGNALAQEFLAIVIDVSDPRDNQINPLPDPLCRDDIVVYQLCNRDDWYSDHRATVAVALRDAWSAESTEVPAVQNGFRGRAAVVQLAEDEGSSFFEALGGRADGSELAWPELIERLGRKKRFGANLTQPGLYRIICFDNRYAAPDATPGGQ